MGEDEEDPRNHTHFTVIETYNRKTGEHLSSVAKYPNGNVIWTEGRMPSKDVSFIDIPDKWSWALENERIKQ